MFCESCDAQAHRLHYTSQGRLCDECLLEITDFDSRSTRQISRLPR